MLTNRWNKNSYLGNFLTKEKKGKEKGTPYRLETNMYCEPKKKVL